eukprot:257355_1
MGCSNSNCVRGGREEVKFEEGKQSAELTDEEINERMEMAKLRKGKDILANLVHDEYIRAITETYKTTGGMELGSGGFGTVQVVTHKLTGKQFAMKTVDISSVQDPKEFEFFMKEVEIMRNLDHPNIVHLQEVYQTPHYLFLVMDLCAGGNLLETYRFTSEEHAAGIVLRIVNAIRYCHDHGIAHRDLKLENVLLEYKSVDSPVKLVDFGLSVDMKDSLLAFDVVGTWLYMPPEVIGGSHIPAPCDMWSIGVITYLLLCGRPPFNGNTVEELKYQIRHGKYRFSGPAWAIISKQAKNFIKRLLVRNLLERMTAEEAQHHPWLSKVEGLSLSLGGPQKGTGVVPIDEVEGRIFEFNERNLVEKLAMNIVARSMQPDDVRRLQALFIKADEDGDGALSLYEFKSVLLHAAGDYDKLSEEDILTMFKQADVRGHGKIAFNDFIGAALHRKDLNEGRLQLAFDRLDYDHDGFITFEDLSLVAGTNANAKEIKEQMMKFDHDEDGKINFTDFCTCMLGIESATGMFGTAAMGNAEAPTNAEDVEAAQKYLKEGDVPTTVMQENEGDQAFTMRLAFALDNLLDKSKVRGNKIGASLQDIMGNMVDFGASFASGIGKSMKGIGTGIKKGTNEINSFIIEGASAVAKKFEFGGKTKDSKDSDDDQEEDNQRDSKIDDEELPSSSEPSK